jgi:hypothetical protein
MGAKMGIESAKSGESARYSTEHLYKCSVLGGRIGEPRRGVRKVRNAKLAYLADSAGRLEGAVTLPPIYLPTSVRAPLSGLRGSQPLRTSTPARVHDGEGALLWLSGCVAVPALTSRGEARGKV